MSSMGTATDDGTHALTTVIVGGGRGCEAVLRMVEAGDLGQFHMRIIGVADIRTNAIGLQYARQIGVPRITHDYRELLALPGVDLVIELTGSDRVRDQIEEIRPRHVRLIDHFGARLFWQLHQAQQANARQRQEMQEKIEAEQARIKQIFDSIPDSIVVIDRNMRIVQANASFLRSANRDLESVLGDQCYLAAEEIRGDCEVEQDNCPFSAVMTDCRPRTVVRRFEHEDGSVRYASIVAAPLFDTAGEAIGMLEMTRDISHRIRLEEEIRATEIRFEKFMRMAPLASWIKDQQGRYLRANPALCRLFCKTAQEIIGKTDDEIMPRRSAQVLHRGDRRILIGQRQLTYDAQVRINGKRKHLSIIKYPILDSQGAVAALGGVYQDVSDKKEAERELSRTRNYLQRILDNSPLIIVTTDLDGLIVSFNRGAEEILGYAAKEVEGKRAADLYKDPGVRALLIHMLEEKGVVRDYESEFVCKQGKLIPVSITLARLTDAHGNSIGTVGIGRDISQRKALLNQIVQSERLAAVGRLAAGVAHEINNPLATIDSIAGYLEDLGATRASSLEKELATGLTKIQAQVRRCRAITSHLLGFSRKGEVGTDVADVNHAALEVLPFLEKEAHLAGITIHRSLQPGLPAAKINTGQLEEVLINLITNAIHALQDIERGQIWISSKNDNGKKVVIRVRDNGPGIQDEVRNRIFDPFVTTKPLGEGTGLGLSICYGIVKRCGGEIRVESALGEGATFDLVLPTVASLSENRAEGDPATDSMP